MGTLVNYSTEKGVALRALHAAAEALPLDPASLDLVIISDALHFLDTELTARQIARVLAPGGALALVTCGFGQTPFMRGVVRLMEEAAPRRPRALTQSIVHLSVLSEVPRRKAGVGSVSWAAAQNASALREFLCDQA